MKSAYVAAALILCSCASKCTVDWRMFGGETAGQKIENCRAWIKKSQGADTAWVADVTEEGVQIKWR